MLISGESYLLVAAPDFIEDRCMICDIYGVPDCKRISNGMCEDECGNQFVWHKNEE